MLVWVINTSLVLLYFETYGHICLILKFGAKNRSLRLSLIAKFCERTKTPKF